jgi:hypothetical protein
MRMLCLVLAAVLAMPAVAQEPPKKKKKSTATKQVRGKPTPEQIRRFNELQKKNN